jgi:hypothetical protein
MLKILSSSFHHWKEMQVDPPVYAYCLPAGFAEGVGECRCFGPLTSKFLLARLARMVCK